MMYTNIEHANKTFKPRLLLQVQSIPCCLESVPAGPVGLYLISSFPAASMASQPVGPALSS